MNVFKKFSIKYKLISIIMLVSGISLISGFALVIITDLRSFKQEMINNAVINAKLMGEYCSTPLEFGYNNAAIEAMTKLQSIPEITIGVVFDENRNVFASYTRNEDEQIPSSQPMNNLVSFFNDSALHIYFPIVSEGKIIGTVYLKSTTKYLNQKIRKYFNTMGTILLFILIVSYISARSLQRVISKPILGLVKAANTVSDKTDYSIRVHKEGNDEIGILYDGFNNMLKLIETRDSELRIKSNELYERNLELENFIETSPDAIIITDLHGIIFMANNQFVLMSGTKEKENIIGKNMIEFFSSVDQSIFTSIIEYVQNNGRIYGKEFQIHKNGEDLPIEMNSSLVTDTERNTNKIIHVIRDISERKLLEENIRRLRKEYEAFMRHEIKNILFPIQGNAEVLLLTKNDKLDDDQIEHLKAINESVQNAGRLIDNLKKLQDIEQGRYLLNTQKFSVEKIIKKVIDNLNIFAEENNVTIQFLCVTNIPDVPIDNNLVPGVFYNLIKNAIEHVKNCTQSNEKIININMRKVSNRIILTINNKGEIISPDKLELFFEKFNTNREKKKKGTGLGTTYAYLVAKAHGWDIRVDSNEKDGTTITIEIELYPETFDLIIQ